MLLVEVERAIKEELFFLTNLYFVRHAHSIYTPDELERPLSKIGFEDAQRVTELLKMEKIDVVISSPYKRAIQTVQDIAESRDKNIQIVDCFKERKLSTEPTEDFHLAIRKVWEDEQFAWKGGESNLVAQQRGIEAMLQVLETYRNQNIVIGTHGNIMVLMMNYFDKQYDFSFWSNLDMPDIYRLTFDGTELKEVKRVWGRGQGRGPILIA